MKFQLNVNASILLLLIVLLLWWLCSGTDPDESTADDKTVPFPHVGKWGQERAS